MQNDPAATAASTVSAPLFAKLEPLLIFLLPFAVYAGTMGYGFVGPDNYLSASMFDAPPLTALRSVWVRPYFSDYIPVTMTTFWVDRTFFGPGVSVGARIHEIFWFAAGCVGVLMLLRRLGTGRWTPFVVALLYTLHPLCSESVLWLAQRKTLVALAFVLWATERHIAGHRKTAIGLFILSLLAKIHSIALPAILTVYEFLLVSASFGSHIQNLIYYYLLTISWIAGNLKWVRFDLQTTTTGPSRLGRVLNDGPILWTYLRHTAWPTPMALFPAVRVSGFHDPEPYIAWGAVFATFAILTVLARRRQLVSFLWLAGLAALAPTLNLAPQPVPVSAHYLQWALPFWLGALSVVVADRLDMVKILSPGAGAVLLLSGALLVWATLLADRIKDYVTESRLWVRDTALEPDSWGSWFRLTGSLTDDKTQDMGGAAALRALEAPDNICMSEPQRCVLTLAAIRYLLRFDRRKETDELLNKELAKMSPGSALWLRGQRAHYAGDYAECIKLLSTWYNPALQQAATILRRHCRKGEVPPCAFARTLTLEQEARDEYVNNTVRGETDTALTLLTKSHLKLNQLERAFDTAAVLANLNPGRPSSQELMETVYLALGEPALAEKSRKCVTAAPH